MSFCWFGTPTLGIGNGAIRGSPLESWLRRRSNANELNSPAALLKLARLLRSRLELAVDQTAEFAPDYLARQGSGGIEHQREERGRRARGVVAVPALAHPQVVRGRRLN